MKKNKKILFYRVLLIILIIFAVVLGGIIFNKQYEDHVYDNENKELVSLFHEQEIKNSKNDKEKKQVDLKYKGYNVIGLIEIPTINLEYPILEKKFQLNGLNIIYNGSKESKETKEGKNDRTFIVKTNR